MKKKVYRILVVLIIWFAYEYQKPVLTTEEATEDATICLLVPPKRLEIKPVEINWEDIAPVGFSIEEKSGFFNRIMNQREMRVTLKKKDGEEITVRIDAYDGRCLEVNSRIN